jgi:Zn-dependent protease
MFNETNFWVFSQIDDVVDRFFTITSKSYRSFPKAQNQRSMQPDVVPTYEILRRSDLKTNMSTVDDQLRNLGYIPLLRPHPTQHSRGILYILPLSEKMLQNEKNYSTPLILLGLTVASVMFVGIMIWDVLRQFQPNLNLFITSLLYVVSLIGIVGIHEIGHLVASKLHGVRASWPYFIPFPFGYGTMGAFISQKTPVKSRNDLFDVGLAGPIFGLIVAIFFSIIGLAVSITIPTTDVPTSLTEDLLFSNLVFSSPNRIRILLFEIIAFFIFPNLGSGTEIILHPMALAGYIGLFLTGLNLIPIGQLDGGHVARSLVSEKSHRTLTYICAFLMMFINPILAILVLLMYSQTGHSGPLDDLSTVTFSRKIIAAMAVILIILCLPIPAEIFKLIFPMFN